MQPNQDIEHLRLLAVFHYAISGFITMLALFPTLHVAFGIGIVTGALDDFDNCDPPPELLGWMFILIPAVLILSGLTMAIMVALAGRWLGRYRNYTYCLVVAAVECIFVPFGTVLGVFTIIVLMRPNVKQLFEVPETS